MPFELESIESVGTGIRRIVDEQLQVALDELRSPTPKKADAAVHSARKRLKRVRALVRLIRPELGEEVYERENAAFRDAGCSLSQARDAAVLVQTLDSLKPDADPAAFAADRRKLLARRLAAKKRFLQSENGLEAVAQSAEQARDRVAQWSIDRDGWAALQGGLRRSYGDGRAAFKTAHVAAHPEQFHAWRKRVKDLWHQLEILEPTWAPIIKPLAKECHELAEILGKEHDLTVLIEFLIADANVKASEVSPNAEVARSKRLKLRHDARFLGARIYTEKPGLFVKRMAKYWSAWKSDVMNPKPAEPQVNLPSVELEPLSDSRPLKSGDAVPANGITFAQEDSIA